MVSPSSAQCRQLRRGGHDEAARSFSTISTPWKPAVAAAASLSSSVPDRHAVAMSRRAATGCSGSVLCQRRTSVLCLSGPVACTTVPAYRSIRSVSGSRSAKSGVDSGNSCAILQQQLVLGDGGEDETVLDDGGARLLDPGGDSDAREGQFDFSLFCAGAVELMDGGAQGCTTVTEFVDDAVTTQPRLGTCGRGLVEQVVR